MTKRQEEILKTIVKEYAKKAQPVSSKKIVQRYKLGLSSATIRNEMKELERKGYLKQPHTSAGRVPTAKGYRFFIKSLEKDKEIKVSLKKSKPVAKRDPDEVFKKIIQTLAEMSGGMAFGGIKELKSFYQSGFSNLLKEIEFEDENYFTEVSRMMDQFEKRFDKLFKEAQENKTKVFIGKENPLGKTKKFTIIVSGCRAPKRKHGYIGLLGPMRMRYDYNISLINKLRETMEDYE